MRLFVAYAVRPVPLIVCPLQFEASRLRRALAACDARALDITCCGPGAAGVERFGKSVSFAPDDVVLLVGVAGGLHDIAGAGHAFAIDRVVDHTGESWMPAIRSDHGGPTPVTVTSTTAIMRTPDDRRALAQRTGAHLVDLESVAFARLASERGWRWGIVRGVSDDLATSMPQSIDSWIAPDGRTRTLAVLAALLRKPSLARDLRCLRHNSLRGLDSAAPIVARMLRG